MVFWFCLTELLEWGSTLPGIGGKRILASRDLKMGRLAVTKVTESGQVGNEKITFAPK